jgi:hypothetical protein
MDNIEIFEDNEINVGLYLVEHTANTPEMAIPLLSVRVRENVRRRLAGDPLLGLVDPAAGY